MTWTPLPPITLQRAICDSCGYLLTEHDPSLIDDLCASHDLDCGLL